jgi:DNA-binding winged helix-turn-helix (wHTH) protein/tetratricopeptide (TPR) repeat protein
MTSKGIFEFGEWRLDAAEQRLLHRGEPVPLTPKAFHTLLLLLENAGHLVSKDEFMKRVWPDAFVEDVALAQNISHLRKTLAVVPGNGLTIETVPKRGYRLSGPIRFVPTNGNASSDGSGRAPDEKPGENSDIVTLTGRGYQFVAPAQVVPPEHLAPVSDAATNASHSPSGRLFQQRTILTSVITEEREQLSLPLFRNRVVVGLVAGLVVASILAVAVAAISGSTWYGQFRQSPRLTEQSSIVIADFANSTGDPIFDDALKTALTISLRQSPFLNVLSDSEVSKTLRLMTLSPSTKLTPEVARELCQRSGSKAYLAGSIGSLGSEYVLGLKAVNCQNGDTLAQEQVTAASKENVLDALGKEVSKLRGELGESLATVQKFDVPLVQATTSSLEALKAYSLGRKAARDKDPAAALPYDQHAIELDPNFAMGYFAVGIDYFSLNQPGRAREYYAKAFHLREHVSEREGLAISGWYYWNVTGQLDQAAQIFQEEIESYPLQAEEYVTLGVVLSSQGQYEKAAEAARQALRLAPDWVGGYENVANDTLALQRFDETRQVVRQAQARKLDGYLLHIHLCALAFLGADAVAMADQQRWLASDQEYEHFGLAFASDTEAFLGHVSKARVLSKRAVDSAKRADNKESGALWQANAALQQAAYGSRAEARQAAAEALQLAPASQGVDVEAALAFAMAGDAARAESEAQDLQKRFPLDTQMQALWLPAIHAQLALSRRDLAPALNALQAASPIELGNIPFGNNISCLYHVYIRGEAYLAAGQGSAAAAEFQKILDHNGIVWNCWTGALAHLGLARANALQSRTSQGADADAAHARALAAYRDFLALWKDADPDIPILKEAKAEYAKLQ